MEITKKSITPYPLSNPQMPTSPFILTSLTVANVIRATEKNVPIIEINTFLKVPLEKALFLSESFSDFH